MTRVDLTIGGTVVQSEWNDSETARKLIAALPIHSSGSYWGNEFYFPVPVKAPAESNASEVVEPGTIAYWPEGHCLCVFWGPTPASRSEECRAASCVSVVGRVLNPEVLPNLHGSAVEIARS